MNPPRTSSSSPPVHLARTSAPQRILVLLLLAAAGFAVTPHEVRADRVRVRVSGLPSELKSNAKNLLSIRGVNKRKPTEAEIRHLHARAQSEIARALEPFGYYRPSIHSRLTGGKNGHWLAEYQVDPGPAMRLDSVDVRVRGQGAGLPGFRRLVERFPLKKGDVLRHAVYERGKTDLMQEAARGGYIDASFDTAHVRVDLERYASTIRLHYDTGALHYFGDVMLEQNILEPGLVEGYVKFHRGEAFDFRKLLELQDALISSPYFRGAEIVPRRDLERDEHVPVEVQLVAKPPRHFAAGVGYGTDQGAYVRTETELRRLNRNGHRLQNILVYSQIEHSASLQYDIPWRHPQTDILSFRAVAADLFEPTNRTRRLVVGTGLTALLGRWTRTLSLDWARERFAIGDTRRTSQFLMPGLHWSYLQADNRVFTEVGHRVDLDLKTAVEPVLADESFVRAYANAKWVQRLGRGNRGILRLEGGSTLAQDFTPLPPTLRFFAGGAQSVRGFAFQGIGPRDASGRIVGGPHVITGSAEIDRRLMKQWLVAAFYDAGAVLHRGGAPIENAVGVGVRFLSPIGPLRLDVAQPLRRGGNPRIHFTLGPDL